MSKREHGQGAGADRPSKVQVEWWSKFRHQSDHAERLRLEREITRVAQQIHPEWQWSPCMAWVVKKQTLQEYVLAADRFLDACNQKSPQEGAGTPAASTGGVIVLD